MTDLQASELSGLMVLQPGYVMMLGVSVVTLYLDAGQLAWSVKKLLTLTTSEPSPYSILNELDVKVVGSVKTTLSLHKTSIVPGTVFVRTTLSGVLAELAI